MKFLKEHSLFILILLICAVLRLIPLFDYQFTFDELSGLERTQFDSFSEVMEKGVKIDAHPAFVQLLIWYLVKCFGYVTWIVKLPFLLFGFGAVIYAYAFGLRNFSKQTGLICATFFSFSFIFVFYAPIARMYISGVFFSIAMLYYFFEIFFWKHLKNSNFILLGLFALLSALNQHINALFAFTLFVSGFFLLDKYIYKKYLITCALVILSYLPHLPTTLYQLSVPGIGRDAGGWLETPEFTIIFSFLKTLLGTGRVYMLILLFVLLGFRFGNRVSFNKKQLLLFLLFLVNFLIVYFYSLWRSPIFQYSVMLFSATGSILLVSSYLHFENKFIFYTALFCLSAALLYKSYFTKDYFGQSVKTVYEYQFERTAYYKKALGDKNVCPVFFDADEVMKKIYFGKYKTRFDCKISSDSIVSNMDMINYERNGKIVSTLRLFSEYVAEQSCDYFILSSAMPQHQAIVKEYFPYLLENTQTQGINFKLYSKKQEDKNSVVEDDRVDLYSSLESAGGFTYQPKELRAIKSMDEFPFSAKAALNEVSYKEGQVVLVAAKLKKVGNESPLEVCVSVTDRSDNAQYSYNSKSVADFVMKKDSTVTLYSESFNGTNYEKAKYKADLGCYLWNRNKENFELQSFEVRVIDYWPRKWDLWD